MLSEGVWAVQIDHSALSSQFFGNIIIQVYLNFDLATFNPLDKTISFSNLTDGKETSLLLKNNFECSVGSFLYDVHSNESKFSWFVPFYSNKYLIAPKEQFLELNEKKPPVLKT